MDVQVKSVDYYRQQIDLVAVGGGSEATDDEEPGGYGEDDNDEAANGNGHDESE